MIIRFPLSLTGSTFFTAPPYYPRSYLEGIDLGALVANIDPANLNPETGGDLFENAAPAMANATTTSATEPEVTDPRRGLAATVQDTEKEGIEQLIPGVFELEASAPDAVTESQSKSRGLYGIWLLLSAPAVGGGYIYYRKRKATRRIN